MNNSEMIEKGRALMAETLVWDTHSGFMPDPAADLENLSIWTNAGYDHLSIDIGFDLLPWTDAIKAVAKFRHWLTMRPDRFVLAQTGADVRRAAAEGKLAITFDLEGMNALDGRVEMVQFYHDLGVRQMLFAYNRNNLAGGGCHDEDIGLTAFGREVIDEMTRLGMFIDVSHTGLRTCLEVMDYASGPVMFSHSNSRAVHPHGRNITDEQAKACAASGGVIGVNGLSLFLGDKASPTEMLANHIDHLASLVGPEHVGIGLDYAFPVVGADISGIVKGNPQFWPESEGYKTHSMRMVDPAGVAETIGILASRGYSDEALKGILGQNFQSLADKVWRQSSTAEQTVEALH